MIAACVSLALSSNARAAESIPLSALAGTYTDTGTGSFAICTGPAPDLTQIPCSSFVENTDHFFPQTVATVGGTTADSRGNLCGTETQTISNLPVDFSPPIIQTIHRVAHTKSYDPSTGVGQATGTTFTGGKCSGAVFNSSGATVDNTFTVDFVASNDGNRSDSILTALQDPVGSIGDFSNTGTELKGP